MKDMGDVVILTKEEYNSLLADSEKLNALESYGVDNWSGYSDAIMSIREEEEYCNDCSEEIENCGCEFCDCCGLNKDYNSCTCEEEEEE